MPKMKMLGARVKLAGVRRIEKKVPDAFYLTKEWQEARALSIALHAYACAKCGRRHTRFFVDHKVEIVDGGALLDQSNLEPLCGSCHTTKTIQTRARRLSR